MVLRLGFPQRRALVGRELGCVLDFAQVGQYGFAVPVERHIARVGVAAHAVRAAAQTHQVRAQRAQLVRAQQLAAAVYQVGIDVPVRRAVARAVEVVQADMTAYDKVAHIAQCRHREEAHVAARRFADQLQRLHYAAHAALERAQPAGYAAVARHLVQIRVHEPERALDPAPAEAVFALDKQ